MTPEQRDPRAGAEIFINYRSSDSHSYCALLFLELTRRFGTGHVFLDYMSIPAGADYVEELLGRVRGARVVLAVIGPDWFGQRGLLRRARIRNVDDWIRRELVEAFRLGIRVIPVLVGDMPLPREDELPRCLAPLARCQYRRLRVREAIADVDRIVRDLIDSDPDLALLAKRRTVEPAASPADGSLSPERASQLALAAARAARRYADVQVLLPRQGPRHAKPRPRWFRRRRR